MVKEIEKKFLLRENGTDHVTQAELNKLGFESVQELVDTVRNEGEHLDQRYLPLEIGYQIIDNLGEKVDFEIKEARLRDKEGFYNFAIKSDGNVERDELTFPVSGEFYDTIWEIPTERTSKFRLEVDIGNYTYEIDVYNNMDLILAEVEVTTRDELGNVLSFGKDITYDKSYKNRNLAKRFARD